nr:5881_t:CDS:2 [Entrophospora candida]
MLEILLCCKRSRKPEPISVIICRKFVVILFVSITLAVLVILSNGVHNDTPTITRKYSSMEHFPVPVVYMTSGYQFNIECYYYFTTNKGEDGTLNNEYVKQPTYDNSSREWNGSFFPDNLSFIIGDVNKTQNQRNIASFRLRFKITSPKYISTSDGSTSFGLYMHDQEYNPFNDPLANRYALRLSRKQRTILRDSPLNNLGLLQRYPSQSYVVINERVYDTTKNSSLASFQIFPLSFLLETEIDQRNKNALTVVSNVLAIWGGLTAFYIFLFGDNAIKPWGFVQERVLKNVMHNKLRTAPFKKKGTPEERIEALETFLKDYVIDVGLIDQLNKSPYKSHEDEEK